MPSGWYQVDDANTSGAAWVQQGILYLFLNRALGKLGRRDQTTTREFSAAPVKRVEDSTRNFMADTYVCGTSIHVGREGVLHSALPSYMGGSSAIVSMGPKNHRYAFRIQNSRLVVWWGTRPPDANSETKCVRIELLSYHKVPYQPFELWSQWLIAEITSKLQSECLWTVTILDSIFGGESASNANFPDQRLSWS
jgi:hypothetical protein